jgi:putative protease
MQKTHKSKVELLAPAGSFSALNAAINAGCDSVYFGISDFNMRACAAVNFTMENLAEVVDLCKKNNVKAYVTVNTLLYDDDLARMRSVVDAVKLAGADAIIVADVATILYARSVGVNVHISTQLSVSNIESVKFYAQYADRIVLARELSLEQVANICVEIKKQKICRPAGHLIEIEVFGHGALCVAVSGRCGMSQYCAGKSANRGQCTQVCRRAYKITDIVTGQELVVDNNFVMSAADLCTVGMLDKLVATGISALKIEGRGRSAEYVDKVIRVYRAALDLVENDLYTAEKAAQWLQELEKVFNRGFSKGLYMGRSLDEWSGVAGSKSSIEKVLIGKVKHYFTKAGVVLVEVTGDKIVNEGDEFGIIGGTTGIVKGVINGMLVNDVVAMSAKQGDLISFKVDKLVRKNDEFYVFRVR